MLKKTITYNDLDGNPITEDFYFNLSKAEIAEWKLRAIKDGKDSLDEILKNISESKDGSVIIDMFREILSKSVGRRSEDGKRFIKNQEIIDEFMQSDAYSVLFMEFLTDASSSAKFINSVLPADLVEKANSGQPLVELPQPDGVKNQEIAEKPVEEYTYEELIVMPVDKFDALMKKHQMNAPRNLLVAGMQRLSNNK